jgi:hypothetical protein
MQNEKTHKKDHQETGRNITPLRAEGGVPLTIKARAADIDRLNHMKHFFERELGISPSNGVLLRWMIEDYSRLIDDLIDTCNWLGKRHISEARMEKISLISVTRDDPKTLPELVLEPEGKLPTYAERRQAASEEDSKKLKEKLQNRTVNWNPKNDLSEDLDFDPYN